MAPDAEKEVKVDKDAKATEKDVKAVTSGNVIGKVVVHPLVLLSVVDHFNRMSKVGNQKRVAGILLGSVRNKVLDVANSFAVPFDEDDKDASVWYLDHDYLDNMASMFKKVNAKERVVGWYHTGPKLHPNDIRINELIRRFNPNSVLVVIDAKPKELGLPTEAYIAIEEVHDDGTPTSKTFNHIPSEIGAEEAEEVGVEHLLRDIRNITVGTLSQQITNQLTSLKGLFQHLQDVHTYLQQVVDGKLPQNHVILYQLQDIFNLLPNLNVEALIQSITMNTNDQMAILYLASLVRAVIALNNLISNKLKNKDFEKEKELERKKKEEEAKNPKKEEKEGDKKDGEKADAKDKKDEKKEKKT